MRPFGNDHRSPHIFRSWLLHYTRAEKRGILFLLTLIILFWVLPHMWRLVKPVPEPFLVLHDDAYPALSDTSATKTTWYRNQGMARTAAPHEFDPNTAGAEELLSQGFGKQIVQRILRYREKGGIFRRKEDLLRIWGIDSVLVKKLFPYIKEQQRTSRITSEQFTGNNKNERGVKPPLPAIDVNTADSFALQRLPGIGPRLAARIVAFREKLGGYYSLAQLQEVYGLSPETRKFLQEQALWHIGRGVYRKIPVNLADAGSMRHPYISRKQALTLEAYRKQHGFFRDSSAMHGVLSFSAEELRRLFPYLEFSR